jgi:2-haloacid dehalogenase
MPPPRSEQKPPIEVLLFDVFGTVVDWRSTVIRELASLGRERSIERDWPRFADRWRLGYIAGVMQVVGGEVPWRNVDRIHRERLDALLAELDVTLPEEAVDHLNRVWHRLDPWPDSVAGLTRLRSRFVVATLSNGNVSLLVDMAKNAGLPWDCILAADLIGRYKPDGEVYRWAVRVLDRDPSRVAMVAAHPPDLEAARAAGLRTCYVARPLEWGPDRAPPFPVSGSEFDCHARDLEDLADLLEAGQRGDANH